MRGADSAFKSLGKWGNQLQWTGRQLQYNWTLPIVAAGAAATKFALDQDRAMTRVRKVYGDAALQAKGFANNELRALEDSFFRLSNVYGITISQTTDIAAEWAAAGASGVALAKGVELTMRTMILGELDAKTATEALIAIQAQYRFNTDQLRDALARMNAIENETGTTTEDLIVAMSKSAGVARAAGIDVRHLGAMIAALTPAAGSAAQAGNALKTIISRLLAPTGDAADLMRAMNLEIDGNAWQSLSATARIEALADQYYTLSDSQKAVVSAYVASRYQINKFEVLLEAVHEEQSYYNKALEVSADNADYFNTAAKELNAVLDSNAQKTKQAGVILQNSMVKVIQPLLPMIVGMAQWLARLAQSFAGLSPETQKFIAIGLVLLASLGLIARYVGSMATLISVLGRAFTGLRPAVAGVAGAFGLMGKGVEEAADEVQKKGPGKFRQTLTAMRADINKQAPWMVAPFAKMRVAIWAQWTLLKEGVIARIATMRAAVLLQWASMWGIMKGAMVSRIIQMQAVIAAQLLPSFTATMARLNLTFTLAWAIMMKKVGLIFSGGIARLKAAQVAFSGWWLGAQISMHGKMMAIWAAAGARLAPLWNGAWARIIRVQQWAGRVLLALTTFLRSGLFNIVMTIGPAVSYAWLQMGLAMQAIWLRVTTAINTIGMAFGRAYAAIMGWIGTAVTAIWGAMGRALQAIQWFLIGALNKISIVGGQLLTKTWAAISGAVSRVWGFGIARMRAMWTAFVAFMKSPALLLSAFRGMATAIAAGGRGLLGLLGALRTAVFALLTSPWGLAIAAVVGILILFRKQVSQVWENIKKYFADANNGIVKAFDALPNGIKNAFLKVVAFVKAAAQKVYEWMQYLNPFARHSPSLVENVTSGMAAVIAQYGTLTQVAAPVNNAYAAIQKLKDASASLREGAASIKIAEQLKELAQYAPQVVPAFRELSNQLVVLQARADQLEKAVNAQERTVRVWKQALDAASDALDTQKKKLDDLKSVADGYEDSISKLKDQIQDLASTPLTGMGAMADAIFENEMAQKRLRLEIMNLEDAGQTYDDLQNRMASLSGEIETLRGAQNDLRAGGAGSEILSFYDQQIAALEEQQKVTEQQAGPINDAQKALEDLQRQADRMDLEQSLQFDPLTRQIEQAANSMKEMPFDEIIGQIKDNQAQLVPLEAAWTKANAAVVAQQAAVDQAQAAHDRIQASYDLENEKLQTLKDAYDQVSGAIGDVNTAMSDMNAAIEASKGAAGSLSPAMEAFNAGAGAGDFADVGGDSVIGREGGLGDQSAAIDDFTSQIEDELGGAFGGLDMFGPFKDMWNKASEWVKTNIGPLFAPIGDFFSTIFEGVDFDFGDIWDNLTSGFGNINWDSIGTSINNAFHDIWMTVFDIGSFAWDLLGPDLQETFDTVWNWLTGWWDELVAFFSGEGGGGGLFSTVIEAFEAFWNVARPIATFIGEWLVAAIHILWSALNGALGPVLEGIKDIVMGVWEALKGFFDIIVGIFTLDFGRIWEGLKGIFSGLIGVIWGFLEGIFGGLVGAIWGWLSGLWDIGANIVAGIWGGIEGAWNSFIGWLGGIWQGIVDFVKGILGISSPSSVFADIGGWIMEGLGAGIQWGIDLVVGIFQFLWSVIQGVISVIGAIIGWLWNNILKPIIDLIVWYIKLWAAIFTWLWANVIQPIIGFIGAIFNWIWNNVIKPIIDLIVWYIGVWATIITWLWENVISPIFSFIGAIFEWIWNSIIKPIIDLIVWYIGVWIDIITWLWEKVISPTFGFIGDIFNWLWNNIIKPIADFIMGAFDAIGKAIEWVWLNLIKPVIDGWMTIFGWLWDHVLKPIFDAIDVAWDALGTAIEWVWDNVLKPVFDTFESIVSGLQTVFETVVGAIGEAWDGLKEIAATPINFVIDTVLNNGLIKAFNAVVGFFGLDSWKIDKLDTVSFAAGGPVRGYSAHDKADNIPAWLTAKEYVQPVAAVKKYGVGFMEDVRAGRFPVALARGYAEGGTVDQLFALISRVFPRANLNSGRRNSSDYHGRGMAVDLGERGFSGGSGRPYLAEMNRWISDHFNRYITELIYTGTGDDRPDMKNGRPLNYGEPTNSQHRNHVHWAMTPEALLAAQGGDDGAFNGRSASGSSWSWWDLLTDPIGTIQNAYESLMSQLGDNALAKYVKEIPGKIFDGVVDWVTDFIDFDTGGLLPSGGAARNQSGSPERILSPRQTEQFDRLISFLDSNRIPSGGTLEGAIFKATEKAHRAESIGGQVIVQGDLGTTNITNNFYGDLSFPNVTSGDDADVFLSNLSDLAGGRR